MNNFQFVMCDTDSITICKPDQKAFTDQEIDALTENLNSFFPSEINWEFEDKFDRIVLLKTKNYILWNGKKMVLKGSSLKSATLEPKMKEMLKEFIDAFVFDETHKLLDIYHKYIKEVSNITDITPWAKKITLSATTYASTRKNETNIIDAIKEGEYVEGDKAFIYTKSDGTLKLAEKFDGDYNKDKYYEKIYKTALRFTPVFDTSLFLNYKLKKNQKALEELLK